MSEKALIAGLARNVGANIAFEIENLNSAFGFLEVSFFILESDSSDNTLSELANLQKLYSNFRFESLGNLEHKIPILWDRLAHLRNLYLESFLNNKNYKDFRYLIVADLDGTNTQLNRKSALKPFQLDLWAACFANQSGHYYDLAALRHPEWCPNDSFLYFDYLLETGINPIKAKRIAILQRQKRIKKSEPWIEVDSAFGGLGIYKREFLSNSCYRSRNVLGEIFCEHLYFHSTIKLNGGRLFIVPGFINHKQNEHTAHFKFFYRLRRVIKFFVLQFGSTKNIGKSF